jgi:hypothetical protein
MAATCFEKTAAGLARVLVEAAVDHRAFERPFIACDLGHCRATCCHDGVILSEEEAKFLADGRDGVEKTGSQWRTKTREAKTSELALDFPAHFPRTRCVFLDDKHRCHWQLLSVREGKSPWFYKPISCWMHPLVLKKREDRVVLTLLSAKEDTAQFASFTPCGRSRNDGVPARECFRAELEMLREISGRDFYRELNAPPSFT